MICELYLFINSSFVIVNLACSIGAWSVFILLSELSAALLIYTIHMCRWRSFAGVRCPEKAECEQRCGVYCAPDNTVTFTAAISHTETK